MKSLVYARIERHLPLGRSATALLAALIILSTVLLLLDIVPLATGLAGILILWVSALPAMGHLERLDGAPAPILPFAGLYYGLFFGLPIFLVPLAYQMDGRVVLYLRIILEPLPGEVALLVACGVAAMIAAYYVGKGTILRKLPSLRVEATEPRPRVLQALYWILLALSLTYRFNAGLQSVPSIGQFLDPVEYMALGGLYLQWRAGNLPRSQQAVVLLVVLPLEAYWRLRNFYLTELLFLPMFFAFILWRTKNFKALLVLAVAGVMIAGSYGVTSIIRYESGSVGARLIDLAENIVRLATHRERINVPYVRGDGDVTYDPLVSPLINRIGQIWVFQHVYNESPETVPYWGGETYRPLLTSFIPRLLYRNKPEERAGGAFGYRYNLTETKDGTTSFNIPWITELLANFGPGGVLAGMAVMGLFLASLDKVFNTPAMNELEFLIGLTIIFRLGYQESNFSVMTGSLLPLFVSLYLYFRIGTKVLNRIMG